MDEASRSPIFSIVKILAVLAISLMLVPVHAQVAYWQQLLGGSDYDTGKKIIYLPDGTIVLGVQTRSQDRIGKGNHSDDVDVVITKYATQGKTFWRTLIGGSGRDELAGMIVTPDGGFLCVGTTDSKDGDFSVNRGGTDIWAARVSPGGRLQWVESFGGSGMDYAWCIARESDGNILIGGESSSVDGTMRSTHHGGLDGWLARLSPEGELLVEKHFGGHGNDRIARIHHLAGKIRLICSSDAEGGDVNANFGKKDLWVVDLNREWDITFQQVIGGNDNDDIHDSVLDESGNLLLAGTAFSTNGYVSGQHGKGDGWIVKFDSTGRYAWSHAYGGTRHEGFSAIIAAQNGGYVLVGMTLSVNGDLKQNEGYYDGWFLKIDGIGDVVWSRNIGYRAKDQLIDLTEVTTGGFLALGHVQNKPRENITIPSHYGVYDIWLINFGDPERGLDVRPYRTPAIMIGSVIDDESSAPLESAITLTENSTLDSLTATKSSSEDGSYVLLLPSYGLVSINVLAPGYLFYGQDILTDTLYDKTSIERTIRLQPIKMGSSLVLENIYFETGRWEVLKASFPELNRLVAFLELNPGVKIEISGHTDNTGNRNEKIQLSLNRANAVKEYLETKGIQDYRMSVKGYGMYRPRATNNIEEGRRLNRRVEFTVTRM